jgi:8-amino-7-oxononanoate synthase
MNIGILPALCDSKTVILADKLVHASMIDGIRLSNAQYVRYRHNDLQHLEQLLQKYHQDEQVERIIVVTESIFSMDGDETDLAALAQLKQRFAKTMLYVDEAHAIGVRESKVWVVLNNMAYWIRLISWLEPLAKQLPQWRLYHL